MKITHVGIVERKGSPDMTRNCRFHRAGGPRR
jgi:hypothetical protein